MTLLKGVLKNAFGEVMPNHTIVFTALKNTQTVLNTVISEIVTEEDGSYEKNIYQGRYQIDIYKDGIQKTTAGIIELYADSPDADINTYLTLPGESEVTPEFIQQVIELKNMAVDASDKATASADKAKASESAAASSASAAKASESNASASAKSASDSASAAEQSNQQAADSAQTASDKASQASSDAQQVSADKDSAAASASDASASSESASESAAAAKASADKIDTTNFIKAGDDGKVPDSNLPESSLNKVLSDKLAAYGGSSLIGYSISDAAKKRGLDQKLTDFITAKDFLAKGDFATDDTDAILAALEKAKTYSNRGCVIFLPAGIYNVSKTITIPQYVTLMGAGKYSTMIRCTKGGSDVNPIVDMPNSFSQLIGINVVYSDMQTASGTCIKTTGASNKLDNFGFSAGFIGFWWAGGSAVKVNDVDYGDCYNTGMLFGKDNTGFINDLILTNFFGINIAQNYFKLGSIRFVGRIEAFFAANGDLIGSTYPITMDKGSTDGLRFSNFTNVFLDSANNPCLFDGMNNTTLTDLWISNRAAGAQFNNCFNLDIKGLKAWNNDAQAVILTGGSKNITLSGIIGNNNIKNSSGIQDIYIDGSCSAIIVDKITGHEAGNTDALVFIGNNAANITVRDVMATPRKNGNIALGTGVTGLCIENVRGYTTKSKGQATLAASSTSMTVAHGLSMTPLLQEIRLQQNGATSSPLYVSAVTATTFTVQTAQSNTGNSPFSWIADCSYR